MILHAEGMTDAQEAEAMDILETLCDGYPMHPWSVKVYDGGFFIRHLDFPINFGMNCRTHTKIYSASAWKRQIIRMAGEWLERANLKRGRWDETPIRRIDGLAEKYQPYQPLPENMTVVTAAPDLRTEPRPQVAREIAKDLH